MKNLMAQALTVKNLMAQAPGEEGGLYSPTPNLPPVVVATAVAAVAAVAVAVSVADKL